MVKVNPNTKQILKQAEGLSLKDVLSLASKLLQPSNIKDLTVGDLEELANFLKTNSDVLNNKISSLIPYTKGLNTNSYRAPSTYNVPINPNNPYISKVPTDSIIQPITVSGAPLGEGLSTETNISLYDADAEVRAQNEAYIINNPTELIQDEVETLTELFNNPESIEDVKE